MSEQKLSLPVSGMTCASCSTRLEKQLNKLPGVEAAVNLASETATIRFHTAETTAAQILDTIRKTGFDVPPRHVLLKISGMTCASCAARIENVVNTLPGVEIAVNLASETARAVLQPGVELDSVLAAIARTGYGAEVWDEKNREEARARDAQTARREWLVFWGAVALTLPLLAGMFAPGHEWLPRWLQFLLATPVQFIAGWRFYRGGVNALRGGGANMDVLVALGTSMAWGLSTVVTFMDLHAQPVYFEAGAAVITLVRLGKLLEARAKRKTLEAIEKLLALTPQTAWVERNGEFVETPIRDIRSGDLVRVRPGERLPVDGTVESGESEIEEAALSGESLPVLKRIGDKVFAATQNTLGTLTIRATGVGEHTRIAEIIRLTEAAQGSKAPIQKLADQVSGIFVPVVIGIALVTFTATGWWLGDWSEALIRAVTVLIIACPCALGLATPAAIMAGTGRGAQMGILFRNAQALETAGKLDMLAVDKTGTLTTGEFSVARIDAAPGASETILLGVAATLERGSEHPLAKAIVNAAHEKGLRPSPADQFSALPGKGVQGWINGEIAVAGTEQFLAESNSTLPPSSFPLHAGATPIHVAHKGQFLGTLWLADTLRSDTPQSIQDLRDMGVEVVMLTGDHESSARSVAEQLGIANFQARQTPQDKAAAIGKLQQRGKKVGMAGDGINDAPALAQADASFAMGMGTDIAKETADITLARHDLAGLAEAIALSRATLSKIRQNLFFAFVYNVLGIPLAALGLLSPVFAGAAMAMSSVSVMTNALLLRKLRIRS
jgi:Cu+-exporting ATPase